MIATNRIDPLDPIASAGQVAGRSCGEGCWDAPATPLRCHWPPTPPAARQNCAVGDAQRDRRSQQDRRKRTLGQRRTAGQPNPSTPPISRRRLGLDNQSGSSEKHAGKNPPESTNPPPVVAAGLPRSSGGLGFATIRGTPGLGPFCWFLLFSNSGKGSSQSRLPTFDTQRCYIHLTHWIMVFAVYRWRQWDSLPADGHTSEKENEASAVPIRQ